MNVNLKKAAAGILLGMAIAVPTMLPADAAAQTSRRQKSKNQWRNLAIAGGVAGVLGLATKNKALTYGGLAGGAYSAYRYEQDRKGQRREQDRNRASRWRRSSSGRAQRFATSGKYRRTKHGYVTPPHDNGLHKGWYKNGKKRD